MNVIVLRRRLVYISAIVLLLVPLYFLGRPSVREQDGSIKQAGGVLSQIRDKYDLGQGDLGEIDPASESMRLATLGLRGVAATILWQKAEYYKKEQFWDRLSATLQQIAVLQPHFVNVWEFQAHNMSYNVSSEFDDYRQRYQWVKRGMNYLIKGAKYNKKRTEMPFELGWFFGNKFGVADEKKQFREMYREDNNFHAEVLASSGMDLRGQDGLGPDRRPDNWLSGVLWYNRASSMVEAGARPCKSTMMFYRQGPQWLMKYADGLQAEGILDVAAKVAWGRAGDSWAEFGDIRIRSSFGDELHLREIDRANSEYDRLSKEFQEFAGETYDSIYERSRSELSDMELEAWDKLDIDRNFDEVLIAESVARKLTIPPEAVARNLPEDKRVEGIQRAEELSAAKSLISHIEIYRNQINYPYWEARCEAEQEQAAVDARTSMFDAGQLLDQGELDAAVEKYEIAWENWHELFNKHPAMMIDDTADEVLKAIEDYRRLLDAPLPEDFSLSQFMKFRELYDDSMADPAMMSVIASWTKRFPGRDFLNEMLRKTAVIDLLKTPTIELDQLPVEGGAPVPPAPEPDQDAEAVEEPKAEEAKAEEAKPEEAKPEEAKPEEAKPEEAKPEEARPALSVEKPASGSAPVPTGK